jgi:hypothetical protein
VLQSLNFEPILRLCERLNLNVAGRLIWQRKTQDSIALSLGPSDCTLNPVRFYVRIRSKEQRRFENCQLGQKSQ